MIGFIEHIIFAIKLGCEKLGLSFCNWINSYCHITSMISGIYLIVFSAIVILFLYVFIKSDRYSKLVDWISNNIFKVVTPIWIFGVLIYIIGFYGKDLNGLAIIPRAIISSFKMFIFSHDLARVHPVLQEDAIYLTLFSIVHFAAAFISVMFIFKLISFRFIAWDELRRHKKIVTDVDVVHVFWGINEPSFLLAKNVSEIYPGQTIIFIDIDVECDDCSSKRVSLNMVANNITIGEYDMKRLKTIPGTLVDHCYNGPAVINSYDGMDIFSTLHLKDVGDIVGKAKLSRHYFLSNDEKQNFQSALNLKCDCRFKDNEAVMYVHARKDANNEIFDHYSQYKDGANKTKIKIVDSAYLAVSILKTDDRYLPVNCVSIDRKSGLVESPFNALIIGFGHTGQEAFKFLYEFSAFVGKNMEKTPFKCYAIDEKMSDIEGLIRTKMPAITDDELSLIHASVDSDKYWENVKAIVKELNYVVVALNDDSLGLSVAVNLFKYAIKYRSATSPMLKILLRCYDNSSKKRMDEVISCLNNSTAGLNIELMMFGEMKQMYMCNNILTDTILKDAKEYHWIYENRVEDTPDKQWVKDFIRDGNENAIDKTIRDTARKSGKIISRYHAIYDINRRISQNISNSLHCRTKMILMGFDEKEVTERLKLYYGYVSSRQEGTLQYACNPDDAQLLINMAIVEHERWIASHKLMGYKYADKNDPVMKYHNCICPWNSLEATTQSYDCNVVDTTIKLAFQNYKGVKK